MPVRPPIYGADDRRRDYASQRGSAREQGYTTRWDRLSRTYRSTYPLCLGCLTVGRTALAQVVDHVLPHRGDPVRMWDTDNLQPLCKWHHDVIKQRLELMHAQGLACDADLHITSDKAVALTQQLDPGGAGRKF